MPSVGALQGISQACFGLSYLLALGFEIAGLRFPHKGLRTAGLILGASGLFAHTLYLAMHKPSPALPYGSLLLLAWVLAVFYFYGAMNHKRQVWAIFVLPVVLGLVSLAIVLMNTADAVIVPAWLHGERLWGAIHGIILLLAAVGVSVSFLASVMYLLQAGRLRRKQPPIGGVSLLSLERLDLMNRRAIFAAVPLLTAGLMLGGLLLNREQLFSQSLFSIKVLGTLGLWLVALLVLVMRYAANVPARRLAWLSILAFTLLVISLAAVHPFAEAA
jgi:ABC-type transport system involved in cytochrome c biogenesis permease subunit